MKKILTVMLVISMILAIMPFTVNALVVEEWEIEISGNEATIIGYTGKCPDKMTLPTMVSNYKIVGMELPGLGNSRIFTENVQEIVVPEGYKSIKGFRMFDGLENSLKKLTLPNTLEKFEVDFYNFTELKEITIPGGVKELRLDLFRMCYGLERVYLSEGIEVIGNCVFDQCTNLKEIKIPNSVKKLAEKHFKGAIL